MLKYIRLQVLTHELEIFMNGNRQRMPGSLLTDVWDI